MKQQSKTGERVRLHVMLERDIHEWLKQMAEQKDCSIGKSVNDILQEKFEDKQAIARSELEKLYAVLKTILEQ